MFLTGTTTSASEALISTLTSTAAEMQTTIGQVVGVALPVAAGVLVITIGWRLFRNFTRG